MITLDEALARLLALADPVTVETLALERALGRWTSRPIVARRTQPAHDLSAMDGYAIRFADLPGPWRVTGEAVAGQPFTPAVREGEAVRIFTGAALPDGSDTILVQEDVTQTGGTVVLTGAGPQRRGESVRTAGEDFTDGALIIAEGSRITPARIALAAMAGHGSIAVRRTVRVAIATTGSELVPVGSAPDAGLPDSNGPMIAAQLGGWPVDVMRLGIVRDDRAALGDMLMRARAHDILVTTGGASVGDHDLVRPALIEAGAAIDFWKIAIRPGKPVFAAKLGETIVLGLPGNPVSAFVTAELLLKPLIAHLSGAIEPQPRPVTMTAAAPFPAVGNRTDFVRARRVAGGLGPVRTGDSGAVFPLAEADALVIRAAGSMALAAGAPVEALLLA